MSTDPAVSGSGESVHVPVLLRETLQALELQLGMTIVDGTVGAGGHSREILKRLGPQGQLIGLDRDPMMLAFAAARLSVPQADNPTFSPQAANPGHCRLVHASYSQLSDVLAQMQIAAVDRVLLDLGLSSDQLADDTRGFSFHANGPLDLRFDSSQGEPAWQLLASIDRDDLTQLLSELGEEPHAARIAAEIVHRRKRNPVRSAADLSDVVAGISGQPSGTKSGRSKVGRHPATQVFQALRIAVNRELEHVERMMSTVLPSVLKPGGIAVIISFHSLEDRIVKTAFRDERLWQTLRPKPVTPSPAEERLNPRCRTARLRAARRTATEFVPR
jgi:16S rRNA (cytosine1402-N4)-methyltransferase